MVSFRIKGKRKYKRVHKIIAETLIPIPNNYPQVNHINGKKLDNDPNNLEWVTNSYNTQQGYDMGMYHSTKRSHPIKVINKITKKEFKFNSIRECAKILKLNRKTITSILKRDKKTNNYDYEFEYL